jgi:hypothetical protein
MAWRERLRDLILAGGAFAATSGCSSNALVGNGPKDAAVAIDVGQIGCGNANYDPCICGRPEASAVSAMLCEQEKLCQARGGIYVGPSANLPSPCELPDGGFINVTLDGAAPADSADR